MKPKNYLSQFKYYLNKMSDCISYLEYDAMMGIAMRLFNVVHNHKKGFDATTRSDVKNLTIAASKISDENDEAENTNDIDSVSDKLINNAVRIKTYIVDIKQHV